MKGIKHFATAFVSLFLVIHLPTPAFSNIFYYVPTITVDNSTGLDIEIEHNGQIVRGSLSQSAKSSEYPGRIVTGQSMSFRVELSKLTLNESGERTVAFRVKAYYPGTDTYAGAGPSIVLVRQNYRRSVRVTHTYSARVDIPSGNTNTRKKTSTRYSSPRVYNSPASAGFRESRGRGYGRVGAITVYVGETNDIEPIVLLERHIVFVETAENSK